MKYFYRSIHREICRKSPLRQYKRKICGVFHLDKKARKHINASLAFFNGLCYNEITANSNLTLLGGVLICEILK